MLLVTTVYEKKSERTVKTNRYTLNSECFRGPLYHLLLRNIEEYIGGHIIIAYRPIDQFDIIEKTDFFPFLNKPYCFHIYFNFLK